MALGSKAGHPGDKPVDLQAHQEGTDDLAAHEQGQQTSTPARRPVREGGFGQPDFLGGVDQVKMGAAPNSRRTSPGRPIGQHAGPLRLARNRTRLSARNRAGFPGAAGRRISHPHQQTGQAQHGGQQIVHRETVDWLASATCTSMVDTQACSWASVNRRVFWMATAA